MKAINKTSAFLGIIIFIVGCQTSSKTLALDTPSGFTSNGSIYIPSHKHASSNIVFIAIHGKSGSPDTSHQLDLYPELTAEGYEVIAPTMPWSNNWGGILDDGMNVIDAAVTKVTKKGKKAVIIGHSLGGSATLIYASRKPKKGVIGIVSVAPGHMIHHSKRMQQYTQDSVQKAKAMVAQGDENAISNFVGFNNGKGRDVNMTAEVYLSYYNLEQIPDVILLLPDVKLPVLWIAGTNDRLTHIYNMELLFEGLPDNDRSKYIEVAGNHKSVLANSATQIINWSEGL